MKTFDLPIPKNCSEKQLITQFEGTVKSCGLTIASRGTLKTIPGSVHWHLKSGTESGTLEATLIYKQARCFLVYHDNRFAEWIPSAIAAIIANWQKAKCG